MYSVSDICGFKIKLGCSIHRIVKLFNFNEMKQLLQLYENKKYLIISDIENKTIYVALEKECEPHEVLQSYIYAVMLAIATCFYNNEPLVSLKIKWSIWDASYLLTLINYTCSIVCTSYKKEELYQFNCKSGNFHEIAQEEF